MLNFLRWGTTEALDKKMKGNKCISHYRDTLMTRYLWRWKDVHMHAMQMKHKLGMAFGKYCMSAQQRSMYQLKAYARSAKYKRARKIEAKQHWRARMSMCMSPRVVSTRAFTHVYAHVDGHVFMHEAEQH